MGRQSKQAKRDEDLFKSALEWWASVEECKARQAGASPAISFWHSDLPEVLVHHSRRDLYCGVGELVISARVAQSAPWFRPILEYDEFYRAVQPWHIAFRREH